LTLAPGRTWKSLELIFIFVLSAVSGGPFSPAYFFVSTPPVFVLRLVRILNRANVVLSHYSIRSRTEWPS
jgi:hypothetical protein